MDRDGQRILFGQDVHGPIHPVLESNREQYRQSLQKLIDLKADVLCEGHFGVYRPREEVEKYIKSYL
jgi:glyoxylase-like metal-dependent hydrolase (beta-lactamase superfamily II)